MKSYQVFYTLEGINYIATVNAINKGSAACEVANCYKGSIIERIYKLWD